MNEQELNKKLAEWAGLRPTLRVDGILFVNDNSMLIEVIKCGQKDWEWISLFTQSLDACFEHFKPRFKSMACGSLNEDDWKGAWAKVITHKGETAWVREPDIEPALALCKAIEKLIDELP